MYSVAHLMADRLYGCVRPSRVGGRPQGVRLHWDEVGSPGRVRPNGGLLARLFAAAFSSQAVGVLKE
jgi:hypothetical protein